MQKLHVSLTQFSAAPKKAPSLLEHGAGSELFPEPAAAKPSTYGAGSSCPWHSARKPSGRGFALAAAPLPAGRRRGTCNQHGRYLRRGSGRSSARQHAVEGSCPPRSTQSHRHSFSDNWWQRDAARRIADAVFDAEPQLHRRHDCVRRRPLLAVCLWPTGLSRQRHTRSNKRSRRQWVPRRVPHPPPPIAIRPLHHVRSHSARQPQPPERSGLERRATRPDSWAAAVHYRERSSSPPRRAPPDVTCGCRRGPGRRAATPSAVPPRPGRA